MIKAIETEYKGYKFRSRLEARWAIFFDAIGVRWEYEPEGYGMEDGTVYLPDFLIHDVCGQVNDKLWVEVKGELTREDFHKVWSFVYSDGDDQPPRNPTLIVGNIPDGDSFWELESFVDNAACCSLGLFDLGTVNGDNSWPGMPVRMENGKLYLLEQDDNASMPEDVNVDIDGTMNAYKKARQARFEHGETPTARSVKCGLNRKITEIKRKGV